MGQLRHWITTGIALLLCLPGWAADAYPFRVESRPESGAALVVAINDGSAEIVANVYLEGENIVSDRPFPVRVVVPPGASLRVGRVSTANPTLASRYQVRASYQVPASPVANPVAVHSVPWDLPFRPSWYFWPLSFVALSFVLWRFNRWRGRRGRNRLGEGRRGPNSKNDCIYNPKEFRASNRWPRG